MDDQMLIGFAAAIALHVIVLGPVFYFFYWMDKDTPGSWCGPLWIGTRYGGRAVYWFEFWYRWDRMCRWPRLKRNNGPGLWRRRQIVFVDKFTYRHPFWFEFWH